MSSEKSEHVVSGQVWREFCEILKNTGDVILRPETPNDPLERAEGFRYLTRVLRLALESQLENAEPLTPRLQLACRPDIKLANDNPDSYYLTSTLDSRHEYRLWGRVGTVPYLSIGAYFGGMGSPRSGCSGSLEGAELATEADGSFEIHLSSREQSGNWIALDDESHPHQLIVRQTYLHKEKERVAELQIERVGDSPPPPLDAEAFYDRLLDAANYVKNNTALFANWARDFQEYPNEARLLDVSGAQGDPNYTYFQGYWSLEQEEALLIRFEVPECDYWNFQLNNYWLESLDYRDYRIEVNNGAARFESDGTICLVIAHRDPGHPNWIDTAHHVRGTMGLRIVKGKSLPTLDQSVVDFDAIPAFSG